VERLAGREPGEAAEHCGEHVRASPRRAFVDGAVGDHDRDHQAERPDLVADQILQQVRPRHCLDGKEDLLDYDEIDPGRHRETQKDRRANLPPPDVAHGGPRQRR
jgi:hypothetical protein